MRLDHDVLLMDLDGVVFRGSMAVPFAIEALDSVRSAGRRVVFVTNNASRTPAATAARISKLGFRTGPEDVVSSAQAAADVLRGLLDPPGPVLVVGAEGLRVALRDVGYEFTEEADSAAGVVQGFSPETGWRLLAEASYAVTRGVPWVACNLDATFPSRRGIAPGNGTFVEAVRVATRRDPVVAGKPYEPIMRLAGRTARAQKPLVVGDRLDTDVASAHNAQMDSLLVMTGVTTVEDLLACPVELLPTWVATDLRVLTGGAGGASQALQSVVDARREGRAVTDQGAAAARDALHQFP